MPLTRRAALPLLAAPFLAGRAFAQGAFPSRTVRIIVPYTPGGASDIAARLLAEQLGPRWGHSVVVENRAGANGITGTEVISSSPPDGHVLGMVSVNHAVNVALYRPPFDTLRDLSTLSVIYSVPLMLVAAPSFAANTPTELAELARREAGSINFAGTGGAVHLSGELFASRAGVQLTHVPYRGSTAAHPDLLSGRIAIMFDTLPAVLGHLQAGTLKALATTAATRVPAFPNVPTMAETFPGFEATTWGAMIAPARLPEAIATKISGDVIAQLQVPTVRERLQAVGATIVGSGPAEAQAFVAAEVAKWSEVAQRAGIERQ